MTIIEAKCGFNRNTKREILYGPQAYGGANFRHLYMYQGVGQITTFMRHWRQANTIPGKLLKCAVAWTQMTAGTSFFIFQQVHTELPHLESKWFVSMRNFMAQINASFELDNSGVPLIKRKNDAHIMDAILESNRFTDTQIRRLHYCRLFLQAVTVSDLSDATGRQLDPSKLQGIPSNRSRQYHHVASCQPRSAIRGGMEVMASSKFTLELTGWRPESSVGIMAAPKGATEATTFRVSSSATSLNPSRDDGLSSLQTNSEPTTGLPHECDS